MNHSYLLQKIEVPAVQQFEQEPLNEIRGLMWGVMLGSAIWTLLLTLALNH